MAIPTNLFADDNQQVLELSKNNGSTYLLKRKKDESFQLSEQAIELWRKSDGLLSTSTLTDEERKVYAELEAEGLITAIRF